ncbi:MAG: TonB-dependent receptor [Ferruginibacter sp.]
MKKTVLLLCTLVMFAFCKTFAQTVQVTGKVTSSVKDQPLSGATVSVKGTKNATITDASGNYSISISPGATLVVTYAGSAPKEQVVNEAGVINFTLTANTSTMEEVVVIGYGQQKKGLLASSVSTVSEQQLTTVSNTRIEQALQGRVAGVYVAPSSGQPGAGLSVRIRGAASNRNTEPIYIIDGIKSGGIESLDPAEIASVSILKDAGSASIYGSEGGNGVILITTKKGRRNSSEINFSAQYGTQSVKDDYVKMMNASQYQQYLTEAGVNGAPTLADVAKAGNGTNWLKEVTQTAPMQREALSISGGNDKSTYFLGGNIYTQDGIVGGKKAQFKRYTVRINSEHKARPWLSIGENISFSHHTRKAISDNTEFGSILASALVMDPITPVTYASTVPADLPQHVQNAITAEQPLRLDGNGRYYGISNFLKGEYGNPVARIDIAHGQNIQNKIFGNIYADLTPFKNFKFTTRFGIDAAFQTGHNWSPTYWFSDESKNTIANGSDYSDTWTTWQWENFATYTRSFGSHNFTLLAGASQQRRHEVHMGGSYVGLFKEQDKFSYADFVPDNVDRIGSTAFDVTQASFFGRLSYDFRSRYIVDISLRRDGSSLFGPGYKWGTFPAVSAGWVFTKEDFFPQSITNILNFGKLRGSYGENGNLSSVGLGEYQSSITPSGIYTDGSANPLVSAYPAAFSYPTLTWEKGQQTDLGLDLAFLKNRINFTVDYYQKITRHLLIDGKAPNFTGNALKTVNAGSVSNKGVELDLSYRNIPKSTHAFSYEIGGNISFNSNKVTSLGPNTPLIPGINIGTGWTGTTAIKVGEPLWYFNGYKTDGIFQNQAEIDGYIAKTGITGYTPKPGDVIVVDVNGDKIISPKDYVKIGSPHPKVVYGAKLALGFKGFDFVFLLQGQAGNDILMGFNRTDRATANKPEFFFQNRWTGEGSTNSWFRADATNQYAYSSDKMVFDGAFARIRQMQLGYTLPSNLLSKARIKNLRLYISFDDYFTFTKYPGVDPEVSTNGNALGIDRGGYPIPRKITFGLSSTF